METPVTKILVHDVDGVVRQAQAVLAVALQAYIAIGTDGRVKGWNPAAERIFGYTPAQACDGEIADLIVPARFRAAHRAGLARLASGEPGRVGVDSEDDGVRHAPRIGRASCGHGSVDTRRVVGSAVLRRRRQPIA